MPVSQGSITGVARVVLSLEDADQIQVWLNHCILCVAVRGAVVEWLEQLGCGAESRRIA